MSAEPALLRATAIEKRFGAVVAASEINIAVTVGERVSLIGSNGAGKTTFVNMITGYLKPDSGHIYLGERATPSLVMSRGASAVMSRSPRKMCRNRASGSR